MIGGLEEARQSSINTSLSAGSSPPRGRRARRRGRPAGDALRARSGRGRTPPGRGRLPLRVHRAEGDLRGGRCLASSGPDLGRAFWAQDGGRERWTPREVDATEAGEPTAAGLDLGGRGEKRDHFVI